MGYAAKTVFLIPRFIDPNHWTISGDRFFDALLLSYPFAFIMAVFIPYGKSRHVYSSITGMFVLQFAAGSQWIHTFITSIVVYVMMITLPKNRTLYKYAIPAF